MMFENIWKGILVDYNLLLSHGFQALMLILLFIIIVLTYGFSKIRTQQKQTYFELVEQQQQLERMKYSLDKLNKLSFECKEKQRLLSRQLTRIDDSIFEVEEQVTAIAHPHSKILEQEVLNDVRF